MVLLGLVGNYNPVLERDLSPGSPGVRLCKEETKDSTVLQGTPLGNFLGKEEKFSREPPIMNSTVQSAPLLFPFYIQGTEDPKGQAIAKGYKVARDRGRTLCPKFL